MSQVHIKTKINGDNIEFLCDPEETLDILRDKLHLTGTKEGCGTGDCGACSITLDGKLVCSCLVLGAEADNSEISTIEGMSNGEKLHPLQQKFLDHARFNVEFAPWNSCGRKITFREKPRSNRK